MTKNENVYMLCCRPEVDGDVISCCNVKTIEGCVVVNFEVASSNTFPDFRNISFCDGEVGGNSGGMKTICISGEKVDTFRYYTCVNLWVDVVSSFRANSNRNQPFM